MTKPLINGNNCMEWPNLTLCLRAEDTFSPTGFAFCWLPSCMSHAPSNTLSRQASCSHLQRVLAGTYGLTNQGLKFRD